MTVKGKQLLSKFWLERRSSFLVLLLFILLIILCYLFPYTGDDWAWGSSIGMDRLESGFSDYGGRYFGYLIVMIMTRFRFLRALIMAGVLVGIFYAIRRIVKHKWAFYGSIVMMFLMSVDIFAQSVSWVSGFANYGVTALIVLAFLCLMIDIVVEKKKEKVWMIIVAPIFGFGGCLIMENVTVYLVLMSIGIQVYLWLKEKRFSLTLFLFAIGAVIGAIMMFSNSAYTNIATKQDDYREVASSSSIVQTMRDNYFTSIYPDGLFKNVILNISLAAAGFLALLVDKSKKSKTTVISLSVFIIFTIITIIAGLMVGNSEKPESVMYIEAALSLMAMVALLTFSITLSKKTKESKKIILLWLTFFILVGPLFIVTPIGPRNFFTPYMILVTISLLNWQFFIDELLKREKVTPATFSFARKTLLLVMMTIIVVFIGIFGEVYQADEKRLSDIQNEINNGEQTVVLRPLPFDSMMWASTPGMQIFVDRYKLFYGIPEEIELVVGLE